MIAAVIIAYLSVFITFSETQLCCNGNTHLPHGIPLWKSCPAHHVPQSAISTGNDAAVFLLRTLCYKRVRIPTGLEVTR
jgi:hypothetical protein